MDNVFQENACKVGDEWYPHATELCCEDKCKVCMNGEWQDKITGLYPAAG